MRNFTEISTYPYFEDFETGENSWTTDPGTLTTFLFSFPDDLLSSWEFGNPQKFVIHGAYSGNNAWVTGTLTNKYKVPPFVI
jgi:hypothetical protein